MKHLLTLILISSTLLPLRAEEPASPQIILGTGVEGWESQVSLNDPRQSDVNFTTDEEGVEVTVEADGSSSYPGVRIKPEVPWDVSPHGHIEATVRNLSKNPIRITMRVDDGNQETAFNSEAIPPGKTGEIRVYLGAGGDAKLDSSNIQLLLIFGKKNPNEQIFRIEQIVADGPPDETPPVDPKTVVIKPDQGKIFGPGISLDKTKQVSTNGPAQAALAEAGLELKFAGASKQAVTVKPALGSWNLNAYYQVRVDLKNTGSEPVTPSIQIDSQPGSTAKIASAAPIPPGQSATIIVPFAAQTPWEGPDDPAISELDANKHFPGKPGTGTKFASNRVTGITFPGSGKAGEENLLVMAITAENPTSVDLPEWLGKRPPVEGKWTKTFEDNFDGDTIDLTKWNIYAPNFWDKRTHFTKDNVIVNDGTLTLRVEKKTGRHNDSPDGKQTDYATGFADTYGKWTQKYGYFEARMKLPTAPCLWPAFWLMPDRGLEAGEQWKRQSTKLGGMEFDIMEPLSIWGPQRFNIAMHWDDYGKNHKATGSGSVYVPADKDGFLVIGLLWTPETAIFYGNGKELARWENPRISDVASSIILDHVTGGWETEQLDDSQLPADFVVDYVRAWQRDDLATPEDGPIPNNGTPAAPKKSK